MMNNAAQLASMRLQLLKQCDVCHAEFKAIKIARYCSEKCRQRAKYLRKKSSSTARDISLSRSLGLDRSYDWSNKNINEDVFILRVLEGCHLPDIARCVSHYGDKRMRLQLGNIDSPLTTTISSRRLNNAIIALADINNA